MTFLPIVERELRVAARWKATHRIRLWVGGVAILVGGWTMFTLSMVGFGNMLGSALFASLTWIATMYCYLGALYRAADSLSSEKREGTIGLLFLTDLKGFDVVLGKLAANGLHWAYGLLAMFPVLAISWLLGGLELVEFWLTILALINLLFVALAAGMLVSSVSRFERKAVLGTLLLLWLCAYGPGLAGYILDELWQGGGLGYLTRMLSPSYARDVAGEVGNYGMNVEYWGSLLVSHLGGWVMLALASMALRRTWQDKAQTVAAAQRSAQGRRLALGNPEARRRFRRWALNKNPFFWLACRYRRSRFLVWLATLILGGHFISAYLVDPNDWTDPFGFIIPFLLLHGLLKIWFVFETCRRFVDDRQSGALELILCTPCGVKDIVRGQWMALGRHFLIAVVTVLAVDGFLFAGALMSLTSSLGWNERYTIMMFCAGVLVFWVDLVVLGWLGMWLGLRSKHTMAAVGKSVFLILMLPWLLFWVLATIGFGYFFYFQTIGGGSGPNQTSVLAQYVPDIMICGWTLLALGTDAVFGLYARSQLHRRFREQVALQYESAQRRWFRPRGRGGG